MKNYIFDFDGTLADSKQCSVLATKQAFKVMHLTAPSSASIEYYMGIPIEQSFKEMADKELSEEVFLALLAAFRKAYKELEEETLCAFPNMQEVLHQLKDNGAQIYVVSSKKSEVLLRNLQTLQMDTYVEDWIGSDQVTYYKPHPEGILKLIERYHLVVEETVMIGDAIFDMQMGQAAGCHTCAVTWGSHSKEKLLAENPTFLVDHVRDLLQLE